MKGFFPVIILLTVLDCSSVPTKDINYREEMREFVIEISEYTKDQRKNFIIISKNGHEGFDWREREST